MKLFALCLPLWMLSSVVQAEPLSYKTIICQVTASYEEDSPNSKSSASGILEFRAGSRADVKAQPGAYLLNDYSLQSDGWLNEVSNQQYYFMQTGPSQLSFAFTADWKGSGELTLNGKGGAKGFINNKSHVREISCRLK